MIMVLLSSMHKCIYYIIKRERDNIAVFSVSTDKSLSYSFLDMSLISRYVTHFWISYNTSIIPCNKKQACYHAYLI